MSNEEKIQEIAATMRMEGFQLDDDDLAMLKDIQNGKLSYDEARDKILSELSDNWKSAIPSIDEEESESTVITNIRLIR